MAFKQFISLLNLILQHLFCIWSKYDLDQYPMPFHAVFIQSSINKLLSSQVSIFFVYMIGLDIFMYHILDGFVWFPYLSLPVGITFFYQIFCPCHPYKMQHSIIFCLKEQTQRYELQPLLKDDIELIRFKKYFRWTWLRLIASIISDFVPCFQLKLADQLQISQNLFFTNWRLLSRWFLSFCL